MTRPPARRHADSSILAAWRVAALTLLAGAAGGAEPVGASEAIPESAIRAHMEFLAGDALNGRGSGTRDEWLAAAYLGAQAQRIGLEPLAGNEFVETVQIERDAVTAPPVLTAGTLRYEHGGHLLVSHLSRPRVSGPLVRYRAGVPVPPGAVVLMPADAARAAQLAATGAAVLIFPETPSVHERWTELARRSLDIGAPRLGDLDPPGAIDPAPARVWLDTKSYRELGAQAGKISAGLQAEGHPSVGHTWNTLARLPGTDAALPVLLLSAHLDHLGARDSGADRIYNGADDDASGSVAVLALAEALKRGPPLRRTVIFAWFGSEEAGGFGARYFVQKPVVPLQQIAANVEFEMIGRPDAAIDAHTLWLTGWERSDLGPMLARHGARLVADPHPQENFFARSDNIALARRGVVAHTVSSFGLHGDYHQPSDNLAHIDFAHMVESIRSLLEPLRWLADSDFVPH